MSAINTQTNASDKSTVIDPKTGLEWKCQTEGKHTIDNACIRFGVANADNYRLPTVNELKTLISAESSITEKLQDHKSWFWLSSPYVGYDGGAWLVNFGYGYVDYGYRDGSYYVRLVRAGQ